jgi:hypothetical protein
MRLVFKTWQPPWKMDEFALTQIETAEISAENCHNGLSG